MIQFQRMLWAAVVVAGAAGPARAAIIVTTGAGSAVTTADRSATFDAVVNGTDLSGYTEGGLRVTVPADAFIDFDPTQGNGGGFSGGFHFPDEGAVGRARDTVIGTTDGATFTAVEFDSGTGLVGATTNYIRWEARDGGMVIDSGAFEVPTGAVLGFRSDAGGFDQLFVAAYTSLAEAQDPGAEGFNVLAVDNVRVGGIAAAAVPEPASVVLLASGLAAVGVRLRRRAAQ